jgi:hypothetical protein
MRWTKEIEQILASGQLSPAKASKLAGKLSWGACAVFGRGARVYLAAIFHHANGHSHQIQRRLRAALLWWLRYLASAPVRHIPLAPGQRSRLILYTDATGRGALAWVAQWNDRRQFAACKVPRWLRRWVLRRKTQIATWELVAAVCALWHFLDSWEVDDGTEIPLFVDSTVPLGTLLRGSSRQRDWNSLLNEIWFQTAARCLLLLGWRVPSKQNLADAPTRPIARWKEIQELKDRGFREVEWRWPVRSPWHSSMC